jgi:hypothetical protein
MATEPERIASWVVLLAQVPGSLPKPAGVLLLDPVDDKLYIALSDVDSSDEDIKEVWGSLPQELAERSSVMGGARLLDSLEEHLSLFLQIEGPRQFVATVNPEQTLGALFQERVMKVSALAEGT